MLENQHVSEEVMVDFILGNLNSHEEEMVKDHVITCERCQIQRGEWHALLGGEPMEEEPSPFLKQRVDKSIYSEQKTSKRNHSKKPVFVMISGVIALLLVVNLFQLRQQDITYEVVQNDDIEQQQIVDFSNNNTNQLDIISVADYPDIQGNVWVNEPRNEVLMEVEGLDDLQMNEYQIWFVHTGNQLNGELLNIQEGGARVYYRVDDFSTLEQIKASLEPVGGSEQPTGPSTFYVEFAR